MSRARDLETLTVTVPAHPAVTVPLGKGTRESNSQYYDLIEQQDCGHVPPGKLWAVRERPNLGKSTLQRLLDLVYFRPFEADGDPSLRAAQGLAVLPLGDPLRTAPAAGANNAPRASTAPSKRRPKPKVRCPTSLLACQGCADPVTDHARERGASAASKATCA